MPDPSKQTLSATQTPALFGASPYLTHWMLYKHFADGVPLDDGANSRMSWGLLMQPLILQEAAKHLHMEVIPNDGDTYLRRNLLGCTRDAKVICPDRGPGALETKCVFDYKVWMADWNNGRQPPRRHEIQLQQQIFIGDGDQTEPYTWGLIVAWVCGDLHFFERRPLPKFWSELDGAATTFFDDVREHREPEPFGHPVELPWLNEMFPVERGKAIYGTEEICEAAIQYQAAKEQAAAGDRGAEPLRAKLLAYAKDAEIIDLPNGGNVTIRPHGKGKRITVWVPDTAGLQPGEILHAG